MQITVVGRHFDVTEPIKNYVDSKIVKLDRYSSQIIEAHVILEVQKVRHIAEISLFMKDFKLTATEESRDMYASIDKALGNLHKQLLKLRDRVKEHKGKRISRKFFLSALFGKSEPKAPQAPKVIKREFQPKPMSVEEACEELELFKDSFLAFRNSKTEKINVVYKREDGNYGLIET